MSNERIFQDRNSPSENLVSYTHDNPLDLKIEPSAQPKNTFKKRCVVWVNVAPRCQASIDRARRLPEARPRPSTLGSQGTGPIFMYTLHRHELVHRGFEPSVPGLWWSSGATGGARRDRCRHREVRNAGRFAYHAESTNFRAVGAFRLHTIRLWRHTLRHRKCAPLLKPAACP